TLSRVFGSSEPSRVDPNADDDPVALAKMTEVKIGEGVQLDPLLLKKVPSSATSADDDPVSSECMLGITDPDAEDKLLDLENRSHRLVPLTSAEIADIVSMKSPYIHLDHNLSDVYHLWLLDRDSKLIIHRVDVYHCYAPGELQLLGSATSSVADKFSYAIEKVFTVQTPYFWSESTDYYPLVPEPVRLHHLDVVTPCLFPPAPADAMSSPHDVRLACWNVNSLMALCRKLNTLAPSQESDADVPLKSGLLKYLDDRRIDVMCLQETMLSSKKKLRDELLGLDGWLVVGNDSGDGHDGVVTMIRKSTLLADTADSGFLREREALSKSVFYPDDGRCLAISVPGAHIVNVYVPNGTRNAAHYAYKLRFLRELYSFIEKLCAEKPVILVGDFNVAHTELDVCDKDRFAATSGFLAEERELLQKILNLSFVDGYRTCYPYTKTDSFTWYDPQRRYLPTWRVDYILLDKRLSGNWTVTKHWDFPVSDHAALLLDYRRASPPNADESTFVPSVFMMTETTDSAFTTHSDTACLAFGVVPDELRRLQREDPSFGDVVTFLKDGTLPDDKERRRRVVSMSQSMVMRDGLLYRVSLLADHKAKRHPVRVALCVPLGLRSVALEQIHDDLFAVHFGLAKIKPTLLDLYWWPSIIRDADNH
ncbi:hypothetical protein HDU96_003410, partial [Phlyctochytrium bullatum]